MAGFGSDELLKPAFFSGRDLFRLAGSPIKPVRA